MNRLPSGVVSVVAGVLALLLVGGVVTESLASRIWPSLLVGLPAGVLAGAFTAAVVYRRLRRRVDS
jgi:hypothetical protein